MNEYRDALINDLNINELRTLFWKSYNQMCINHKTEMETVVATELLDVTKGNK